MKGGNPHRPDTSLRIEASACNGCGRCETVCPHAVLVLEDRVARIRHATACMECGACSINCPTQAIRVRKGLGSARAILLSWLRGV